MKLILENWKKFLKEAEAPHHFVGGLSLKPPPKGVAPGKAPDKIKKIFLENMKNKLPKMLGFIEQKIYDEISKKLASKNPAVLQSKSALKYFWREARLWIFNPPNDMPNESNIWLIEYRGKWVSAVMWGLYGDFWKLLTTSQDLLKFEKKIIGIATFAQKLQNEELADEYNRKLLKMSKGGGDSFAQAYEIYLSLPPEELKKKEEPKEKSGFVSKMKGFFKGKK